MTALISTWPETLRSLRRRAPSSFCCSSPAGVFPRRPPESLAWCIAPGQIHLLRRALVAYRVRTDAEYICPLTPPPLTSRRTRVSPHGDPQRHAREPCAGSDPRAAARFGLNLSSHSSSVKSLASFAFPDLLAPADACGVSQPMLLVGAVACGASSRMLFVPAGFVTETRSSRVPTSF